MTSGNRGKKGNDVENNFIYHHPVLHGLRSVTRAKKRIQQRNSRSVAGVPRGSILKKNE